MYQAQAQLFDCLANGVVCVRPYQETDAQALYEAMSESRAHLRPWLSFADAHQTVDEAYGWILHCITNWSQRQGLFMGVWEEKTQRMLGGIWINVRSWDFGYFEFGYWLRPSATGCGYMFLAMQLLTEYALEKWHAQRLEIRSDERNKQSVRLAQRLGFVQEGRLRNVEQDADGGLRTMLVFSKIPEDELKVSR